MRNRVVVLVLALLAIVPASCGRGRSGSSPDPESPRPTVSLRGGVRGELDDAGEAERRRRELERRLLENTPGNRSP